MPRVKSFDEKEVLQKAMELFWKNGYHATSMDTLVKHLGVNRASLYSTFGGKKELFDASFNLYRDTNTQRVKDFLFSHKHVKEGFQKLFELSISNAIADKDRKGCFVINTATEFIPNDKEMQKVVKKHQDNFEALFYQYLKTGVESGEISDKKNLKEIASMLFTFHNGAMLVAKVQPNRKKLLASVEAVLSII